MKEDKIISRALDLGFSAAAFIDAENLTVVPEYRKYCEMNLCHCYNVNPHCPPECGTIEEMTKKLENYRRVLVLQTTHESDFLDDPAGAKAAKQKHNQLADHLVAIITENEKPKEFLRISAGPWKQFSCLSAYCLDAQKMAEAAGMVCWAKDGKSRFFSQLLF